MYEARSFTHPQARPRRTAQLAWERQLLAICQTFLADPLAVQAKFERHIKELFVSGRTGRALGQQPRRASLRHLVIRGMERGTESKMTVDTWRAR